MEDCIFCKIISREIQADIVYEDDEIMGFHDISPQAPTHLLFVPKEHISSTNELTENEAELMGKLIVRAKNFLAAEGIDSYRLVINSGAQAGQTVYHLHLHALAGRLLTWPPG
jgi:histidine triad (HIT) family protein